MSGFDAASDIGSQVMSVATDAPSESASSLSSTDASDRRARAFKWLDPTTVRILTVVGFTLPVIGYLSFVQHYQVNAIFGDQWYDVPVIRESYVHFPNWSSLWALHDDNRILFPNLIVLALAHTARFNISIEEYLSALMLIAATAVLIWTHKRRSPQTSLLAYCPIAFLMLSLAQWSNALWGFQIAWFLVLLALALTVSFLDRPRQRWWTVGLAVCFAVVASYSSLQGLLVWPVGFVLLYLRQRQRWIFASWVAAAAMTVLLYFINYSNPYATNPRTALLHPYAAAKFYLFALGDIVGVQMKYGGPGNALVMTFGIVILALALIVLFRWGLRRDTETAAPLGVVLIIFGLLFDVLITDGRIAFGLWGASQSRYTTNDILVLAGIYLTVLGDRSPRDNERRRTVPGSNSRGRMQTSVLWLRAQTNQIDRKVVRRVALLAIIIQVAFSVHYGLQGARQQHQAYIAAATATRNVDHETDGALKFRLGLFTTISGKTLRDDIDFLRQHHLSLFG